MAYQKQVWENLPSTNTPLSADRLNHMEEGIYEAWEHGGGGGGDTLPIGVILPLSSDTIPEGYLLCDGSEISRTTYSTLFSVIGTTYGVGDGSTTFNLPNLKGRVPVGQDGDDSDFDTLGETGGGKQTMIPMQWYTDFIDMRLKTNLNIPNWENFRKNASGSTTGGMSESSGNAVMGINENTTVDTNGNLQPYIVVKYVIKALNAQSGEIRSESLPVGTELDYDGETVPTGWEQISDKAKVLWTNPNPTSSFDSQSIILSSNDYDCYQVIYQMSTVNEKKNSTGIVPKGSGTMISFLMVEQGQFCVRGITYTNDTTFLTGDALNSNNSTANNRCIPLYVIGYKTGLF